MVLDDRIQKYYRNIANKKKHLEKEVRYMRNMGLDEYKGYVDSKLETIKDRLKKDKDVFIGTIMDAVGNTKMFLTYEPTKRNPVTLIGVIPVYSKNKEELLKSEYTRKSIDKISSALRSVSELNHDLKVETNYTPLRLKLASDQETRNLIYN